MPRGGNPVKLLEIQGEYAALLELLEQSGGEISPENEATIDAFINEIKSNVAEKTDAYCNLIAHMKARAAMMKERKEIFAKSEKSLTNGVDRLRERLKIFGMETKLLTCSEDVPGSRKKKPGNKIETSGGWVVSVQKAGGKRALTIDENADIPDEYLIYLPPVVNEQAVRAALEEGKSLPFAKLEEQGVTLIIK